MRKLYFVLSFAVLVSTYVSAKEALPPVGWPADKPLLQFTVSKMNHISGYGGQQQYVLDVAVTNLSGKKVSQATFSFYLFDKKRFSSCQGLLDVTNVAPNETLMLQVHPLTNT